MPERREAPRRAARVKVRYWKAGTPDQVMVGYTTNISTSGCFIVTEQPVKTPARLQLELITERGSFVCEGEVARSIKAPVELRAVKPSGMGIRFVPPGELVTRLVPAGADEDASAAEALSGDEGQPTTSPANPSNEAAAAERKADFETRSEQSRNVAAQHPAAPPPKSTAAPDSPHRKAPNARPAPVAAFRLAPTSNTLLRRVLDSEITAGLLFVATPKTFESGDLVRVELTSPTGGWQRQILATYERSVSAGETVVGFKRPNQGILLRLSDPDQLADDLRTHLRRP